MKNTAGKKDYKYLTQNFEYTNMDTLKDALLIGAFVIACITFTVLLFNSLTA